MCHIELRDFQDLETALHNTLVTHDVSQESGFSGLRKINANVYLLPRVGCRTLHFSYSNNSIQWDAVVSEAALNHGVRID